MRIKIIQKLIDAIRGKRKLDPKFKIEPNSVTIDISNRCNAKCPFCPRQISKKQRNNIMERDLFYKIMEEVSKIKSVKTIGLGMYGEPMLHPNFDEFVDYLYKKGYKIVFPTNMSLAHKHFDSLLKCSMVVMSIEGHDEKDYEYKRKNLKFNQTYSNVVEFDRLIKQKRKNGEKTPERVLNFLVDKNSKIKDFMALWLNYTDKMRVGPILPFIAWDSKTKSLKLTPNEEYKDIMIPCDSFIKDMYCHMIFKDVFIRPDGTLALCCSDFDIEKNLGIIEIY